ncbi:MAG: hypothetical protein HY720_13445 [Planctomycetes bacterium]|nr:hypothetical protein [Planctomycetota bacterium]
MSFEWPEFRERTPIDSAMSWSAEFESYDQRKDDCYYAVTLHEGDREATRFYVKIDVGWVGGDCTDPEFLERMRTEIHTVAARGRTNTEYIGSLTSWLAGTSLPREPDKG